MSEIIDMVMEEVKEENKNIEKSLMKQLAKVRTGRASPNILDDVKADYYGQMTPIRNMSNINIPEPRLMVIQPYDPSSLKEIEKAIQAADLGLNPHNDGKVLRLTIPELTEERRKELAKRVKKIAEDHRVSVRQVRKDANDQLKQSEKDKEISEDELHQGMDKIQKEVDKAIEAVDEIVKAKEEELMEI